MNSRNALLILLSLIFLTIVGGRLYARKSASEIGAALAASSTYRSGKGFSNTAALRDFLAGPEIQARRKAVQRFAILGGGYKDRIEELQQGLIFLSQQMALPEEQRSPTPPTLRHFEIELVTTSDRSVFDAASKLIHDFREQVSGS